MSNVGVENDGQLRVEVDRALQIASGLHDEGKSREAERIYHAILAEVPAHHDALFGLGLLRARAEQMDDAADLFTRAIEAEPASADALIWLGVALAELGRHEEALTYYQKGLSINPGHAVGHCGLGALLRNGRRIDEAITHFERAIAIRPDFAAAHCALADILHELDFLDDAMSHYEQVVAVQPRHVEAMNNLANLLQKLGRFEEAIALYERALTINPESAELYCNLGGALIGASRAEESIVQIEKALRLDPSNVAANKNLGFAFEVLGRIEDAVQAYERASPLAPSDAEIHRHLANLRRFTPGDSRLAALEKLAGDMANLDTQNQISLHFALGKAFCDLCHHERSFHHWRTGNALKRAHLAYHEQERVDRFERIRTTFTSELMQRNSGEACPSDLPVFVVGMPRSGTTLVEQILASHSKVHGAGEIETLRHAVENFRTKNDIAMEFPEMVPALSQGDLRDFGADYVALTRSATRVAGSAVERIINKLPGNFELVGLIHLALPNARIIHVRRDAVDTCFSCFSLLFAHGHQPFTYDLGELGRYYRGYETLMQHWRSVLAPGMMLDIRYEDIVADLEKQARAIVDYCGLAWEERCLAFHESKRPVRTSSLLQVRKPLYQSSVGRWRAYESFLQPLIEALNAPHAVPA
ncbi:tetratricopeptide repeat-containing sulfotransferase family protein [Bradyrhizobium sp.]|uniref:tetratricopeptide repeat-containing sulfotransferase family protein n=1 Tax=Bradyrhizobium sp. TaxID=376 RepID=UPI003C5345A8